MIRGGLFYRLTQYDQERFESSTRNEIHIIWTLGTSVNSPLIKTKSFEDDASQGSGLRVSGNDILMN